MTLNFVENLSSIVSVSVIDLCNIWLSEAGVHETGFTTPVASSLSNNSLEHDGLDFEVEVDLGPCNYNF